MRWLKALLGRPSRDRSPPARGVATSTRAQAYAELRAAEHRRDDRAIGRARMVLMQATHDELADAVWP